LRQREERRVELELQLLQAQKLESVGRLASGIAHDFNNLLTVISGNCCLLQDDETIESQAEIEEISRAVSEAAQLTRRLLTFSRRHPHRPERLRLEGVVREMEPMLRRLLRETIVLEVQCSEGVDPIWADAHQIENAVMNMVVNSSDAIQQSGKITIRVAPFSGTSGALARAVRLTVLDTGSGMDEATQTRIFDPFFTTQGLGKGSGLGLAMVHGIVQQSGGVVRVRSVEGEGTELSLIFPACPEPEEDSVPSEKPRDAAAPRSLDILLVDDQEAVRNTIQRMLESAGHRVVCAESSGRALAVLRERPGQIDIVITDVVMPDRTGTSLAHEIRTVDPAVRVVYMTGHAHDVVAEHGVEADALILQKPFTQRELEQQLIDWYGVA
jgi:CheY-like chemotaxis protein